jgi:uncharacterized protein (DUF952 family)
MIYHIAKNSEWSACANKGEYVPSDFDKDGFIHCSEDHQVEKVANWLFKGQKDLVLLKIDPTKLNARTIYESPSGTDEKFPHVYGPINIDAIVSVSPFACN